MMRRALALCVLAAGLRADTPMITRAVAGLNGVYSPRGFFNITVRLYRVPGVDWAKYDLKKSQITIDFEPGVTATQESIWRVMKEAGYKPGPVRIEHIAAADAEAGRSAPGWVRIKHPRARNAVARWFQLNF
jgi:copper chaperone CopZ